MSLEKPEYKIAYAYDHETGILEVSMYDSGKLVIVGTLTGDKARDAYETIQSIRNKQCSQ